MGVKLADALIQSRKGFIPFVTAGDPDLETSLAICLKLAELGADVIELGVPFSDPMADGPTIQRSSQRALARGVSLLNVLDLAKSFRAASDVPLVLFTYFNPVLSHGLDKFAALAKASGIDGVLLTDVIGDEADAISSKLAEHEIHLISLVAPTTTHARLEQICRHARGFLYAVSRAGVTGARESVSDAAEKLVARTRKFTDLPIAVGFGISTAEQIADVWRFADAAVVGSAIVAEIEKHQADAVAAVESFVSRLLPSVAKAGGEL
ncbi:MAG: tryptophan synthase subunit alpha [Acidobacteria bacterium]|nr:tryptophan synthase subunit alpha [Acidobacteriota bacterium]